LTSDNSAEHRAAIPEWSAQILSDKANDGLCVPRILRRQLRQVGASGGIDSFESTVSDTLLLTSITTSTATR